MISLTFLGTGSAMVTKRYNTSFLVKQNHNTLLVDCGGGHEILTQLEENKVSITEIDAIFVTHSHIDHILGFPFLFRRIVGARKQIKIFCSESVKESLLCLLHLDKHKDVQENISLLTFQNIDQDPHYKSFFFIPVSTDQHGFILSHCTKKISFTGDIPCNSEVEKQIMDSDFLIHEAFCSKDDLIQMRGNHSKIEDVITISRRVRAKKILIVHSAIDLSKYSTPDIGIVKDGDIFVIED